MFTIYDSQIQAFARPFGQKRKEKILKDLTDLDIGKVYEVEEDIIIEDSRGNKTVMQLNEVYLPEKIIKPSGIEYGFKYDERERLIQFNMPGNESIVWEYDLHLLTSICVNKTRLYFEYDEAGRICTIIYPDLKKQLFAYNGSTQLNEVTTRAGGKRKFETTLQGNTVVYKITDALQRTTCFECDPVGNIAKVIFPDKSVVERICNWQTNTEETITRNKDLTTICYNRVITEVHSNEGWVTLFARPSNFLEAVDDGRHTILFSYDKKGHLLNEAFDDNNISLEYDEDGRLIKTIYPSGLQTFCSYDADGRLSSLAVNGKKCVFTYKDNDTIASIKYPNGLTEFVKQTIVGGAESIVLSNEWQELLSCHRYSYNELFQLTRYYRQEQDYIKHDCHYLYDADGRITHGMDVLSGNTEKFRYDDKGNMIEDNGAPRSIGSMDQLLAPGISYDANGNMVTLPSLQLAFTDTGLLKKSIINKKEEWTYSYDGLGRRIEKASVLQRISYRWLGSKLISESFSNTYREYVYDTQTVFPIGFIENGQVFWLHRDVRGAVCTVTNEMGRIVWSAVYDAFGKATILVNTIRQPWRLLDQYCDEETGLYYCGVRYYSAVLRSYLSLHPHWYMPESSHYGYSNRKLPPGAAILEKIANASLWRPTVSKGARPYQQAVPGLPVLFSIVDPGPDGSFDTACAAVMGTLCDHLIDYLFKCD